MLRKSETEGWILVTHPDHARLAGEFASRWGNDLFAPPEPRQDVLEGIFCHDDGWKERDHAPQITRQGLPSAFSVELVGKYSAFEEIDLADYLAVRRRALEEIAQRNPYAAVMVSMHTHNLLSQRVDRDTIRADDLILLDSFLAEQLAVQTSLRARLQAEGAYPAGQISDAAFDEHFALLQACDCLSLLACVDYEQPSDLLHDLSTRRGDRRRIKYLRKDAAVYALDPFPFAGTVQKFEIPCRFVRQRTFASSHELTELYLSAPITQREMTFIGL
jgi:hypothetical protein